MPTVSQKIGTTTGFTASANLNSLADGQAKPLGVVDNTSLKYPNAYVSLNFAATSGLAYEGAIELYFLSCIDTTSDKWSDDINPDTTSNVSASIANAKLISPTLRADNTLSGKDIVWVCNDLAKEVGDLPLKWTIIVYNKTGQAFRATGKKAVYRLKTYQV
jgi:hypothetical protein